MATKTVVCPECDSPLAPGRFSCSTCGALVASVASTTRSLSVPEPAPMPDPAPAAEPELDARDETVDVLDDAAPQLDPLAEPVAAPSAPIATPAAPAGWFAAALETTPPGAPSWPDHPTWPLPVAEPMAPPRNLSEGEEVNSFDDEVDSPAASDAHIPAGAYLPPSAVLPPAETLPLPAPAAQPRATDRPARTWPELGNPFGAVTIPGDAGTRTIAVGAAVAAFGFLLPWADIVIGSGRIGGGLLDRWGLAGPAAPTVFLLTLGLFALAVMRANLPVRVGLSTASIGVASLLLGLAWPYLFGSFGASFGIYAVLIGALVLAAGGVVDRFASRHGESRTAV